MALRRPSSPTNTTFSGISNYRSDSYRPIRDKDIPPMPPLDSKRIAKVHWDELQAFLASHLAKGTQMAAYAKFLSLLIFTSTQNPQIHAPARGRSSPGSQGSNSRSCPLMYMMNSSGALQALKVSVSFAISRRSDPATSATPAQ